MELRVRVERIRHAFQTMAPESACEADTVQSTKGQEVLLKGNPSFDQEPRQACPKDECGTQPQNDIKAVELSNTWSSPALIACYG